MTTLTTTVLKTSLTWVEQQHKGQPTKLGWGGRVPDQPTSAGEKLQSCAATRADAGDHVPLWGWVGKRTLPLVPSLLWHHSPLVKDSGLGALSSHNGCEILCHSGAEPVAGRNMCLFPHPTRLCLVLIPFARGMGKCWGCDSAALPDGDSWLQGEVPARPTLAWHVLPLSGPATGVREKNL